MSRSCGVFGFTRECLGGRRVHSGLLDSLGYSLVVVGLIRCRSVHSGTPCGSLGLFGVFGYTRVRSGGSRVHSGSSVSRRCALGVVGGRWIHAGAPWKSFLVIGFTRVRAGGRRVHSGSFGSLRYALGVVVFIRGIWVHAGLPWCRCGHAGAPWVLWVVGFMRVRPGICRFYSAS